MERGWKMTTADQILQTLHVGPRRVVNEVMLEYPTKEEMCVSNPSLSCNGAVGATSSAAAVLGYGWDVLGFAYHSSKLPWVIDGAGLNGAHTMTHLGGGGNVKAEYDASLQLNWPSIKQRLEEAKTVTTAEPPRPGISTTGLGSSYGANDTDCMEMLLMHCAAALEMKNVTSAQQIMWVLNNFADPDGDTNQRLTSHFLKALVNRATKMGSSMFGRAPTPYVSKLLSPNELAGQVDVMPWYRFGYSAANGAMVGAFEGKDKVHIIDFSTTHCMQWPTLIEALSERSEGPPHIRLTVHDRNHRLPPLLSVSYDELGERLSKFARMKNVPFQFHVITQDAENLDASIFGLQAGEAVAVNCMLRLHYICDESSDMSCPRDRFLRMIRSLDPTIVTLVEEDSNLSLPSMVARLKAAFNYLWIPFDALDTFLPRDSSQRLQYEGDIGLRIDNIISCEGMDRVERLECKETWVRRMTKAGFQGLQFKPDLISKVVQMLHEHASGWGLKKENDSLLLTWKGHSVVFASAWAPSCSTR